MTKGQFIEIIKGRLGWKFGDRTIAFHIENAWNQVVGQLFLNDSHQLDLYTKSYEVDVAYSDPRYYALLPVKTIQYKDAGGGVRQIHTLCDEEVFFVPMRSIDFQLYSSLDAGIVGGDVLGYVTKADRVEFFGLSDSVTKVRMDIVPSFPEWGDDDDFPMPSGMAENIYGLVVQAVQENTPTDTNIFKDQVPLAEVKD
jgi:hypothetical protein